MAKRNRNKRLVDTPDFDFDPFARAVVNVALPKTTKALNRGKKNGKKKSKKV